VVDGDRDVPVTFESAAVDHVVARDDAVYIASEECRVVGTTLAPAETTVGSGRVTLRCSELLNTSDQLRYSVEMMATSRRTYNSCSDQYLTAEL